MKPANTWLPKARWQAITARRTAGAHTVTVSDLSDNGVHTSIRYGTKAGSCNQTSAPNYTEAGYYPVYYEIDYEYDGENMVENGVSYVLVAGQQHRQ